MAQSSITSELLEEAHRNGNLNEVEKLIKGGTAILFGGMLSDISSFLFPDTTLYRWRGNCEFYISMLCHEDGTEENTRRMYY